MGGVFALIYLLGFLGFGIWMVKTLGEVGGLDYVRDQMHEESGKSPSYATIKLMFLIMLVLWPVVLIGVFISNMNNNER